MKRSVPIVISASRRSDIPRYFWRWFERRRIEGFADFRTAYGVKGRASLAPDQVLGYVFWTRDARPFESQVRSLRSEGGRVSFQFTIAGNGRDLEPHSPAVSSGVESFLRTSALLPEPACIEWRYDPIVMADRTPASHHTRTFSGIARALRGATRVVNVSIVEPCAKALRRISDRSVRYHPPDSDRQRSVLRRYPDLRVADEANSLLQDLADIARGEGIELRVCCNPEYGQVRSRCIGPDLFAPYGIALEEWLRPAPSRSACLCLRSVDIGMDNTCIAGCKYCYAVTSQEVAIDHFRQHDRAGSALRS